MVNQASGFLGAGVLPGVVGNSHPSIAPYQTFSTADRPIAVAVGNDKQFAALAKGIGPPWLIDDARFTTNPDRVRNREALTAILEVILKTGDADHWVQVLRDTGAPVGPINDLAEAFARQLGLTPTVPVPGTPTPQVANPIDFSATPVTDRHAPPALGRDGPA